MSRFDCINHLFHLLISLILMLDPLVLLYGFKGLKSIFSRIRIWRVRLSSFSGVRAICAVLLVCLLVSLLNISIVRLKQMQSVHLLMPISL